MKFWDSSAVASLCVREPGSAAVRAALSADPAVVVWWATRTECVSALVRRAREGHLTPAHPAGQALVTFDTRLGTAGAREGFTILPGRDQSSRA